MPLNVGMLKLPHRHLLLAVVLAARAWLRYLLLLPLRLYLDTFAGSRSMAEYRWFRRPDWKAIRYPQVYTGSKESAEAIIRENRLRRFRGDGGAPRG